MDPQAFRDFCMTSDRVRKGLPPETIDGHIRQAAEFEQFLAPRGKTLTSADERDTFDFAQKLADEGRAGLEPMLGLIRLSRFVRNNAMEAAVMVLIDGPEVMDEVSKMVLDMHGKEKHERIFADIVFPPIGAGHGNRPAMGRRVVLRMLETLGRDGCAEVFQVGPHTGPKEAYADWRTGFLAAGSVDAFIAKRREDTMSMMEAHARDGTLFFSQPVTEGVLELLRSNPSMLVGERRGDHIIHTKIPHMAVEYISEKDPKMRRYYYCHCPWVKTGILSGDTPPPELCNCSAGFHKKPWEVAFDRPVKTEIVESVLSGSDRCVFKMEIPKEFR